MNSPNLAAAAVSGLGLGLGLIVAIGAQNAFVLRQGIRREHVLVVVVICIGSDAALIAAGVGGAGALFTSAPWLVGVATWAGALFLLAYAAMAAARAWRGPAREGQALRVDAGPDDRPMPDVATGGVPATHVAGGGSVPSAAAGTTLTAQVPAPSARRPRGRLGVVATTLALTWLNPHVYLDTVVLLGSVGSTHGQARWAFAAGAIAGSTLWFSSLGLAARVLAPVFARPRAWRILDGIIAAVMTCIAIALVAGA
ncbi:LysE family transporter [Arthrobacter sp. NEB 688]|uniref:LysE/ArgO family amino acid transporter n=1 Tax=Arthrobacter sp. NEB 688 TaxID=904039 RepID=UPI0015637EF9|nr:LysE family transporter [Arthrobacter sp. NEB 688]QKE85729.1 LysE family transporter [Arthrobacter sp. NEB 688]